MSTSTIRRVALAVASGALALAPAAALASATSPNGTYFVGPVDMLQRRSFPSLNYVGDMPDASVYYENGTYYAYSTSTNGSLVPVFISTDGMKSWRTNHSYTPPATAPNGVPVRRDPVFNDALLGPARWVQPNPNPSTWTAVGGSVCPKTSTGQMIPTQDCTHMVSPSVVKLTSGPAAGKYLMAYGAWARTSTGNVRMSVTTAIASSPAGPFTDYSSAPLYVGPAGEGSIDPQLFQDAATGKLYVQWMNQGGAAAGTPDSIVWSQEISVGANGVAAKVGSMAQLLSTKGAQPWEANSSGWGTVVEQPSMVRYGGRYYLFFSAQLWTRANYRMGYATCNGPMGPCTRASTALNPLLPSSQPWNADGPGGGSAFVDGNGRLRMIYQAWAYGRTGYSATNAYVKSTPDRQRFGHVAMLDQDGLGRLTVAQRSLAQAPAGCSSTSLFPFNDNWVDMFACQYPTIGPKVGRTTSGQPDYVRVAGSDRYTVSANTSRRAGFPTGVGEVLIVSGANFPDALSAGAYSAGAAPVILVPPTGALPPAVAAELRRLRPATTTVVGGTGSVGADMENQVKAITGSTRRIAGATRYETSARLAPRPTGTTVYVANGAGFADSLAGSVAASRQSAPLLLTAPTSLPAATESALRSRITAPGVTKVVVLGGTGAVSDAVVNRIRQIVPAATVTRLSGADRYATAVATNRYVTPGTGAPVVLVSGENFPDALSAAPYATRSNAELLLTRTACMPAPTLGEVGRQGTRLTTAVGGLAAVSDKSLLHGSC